MSRAQNATRRLLKAVRGLPHDGLYRAARQHMVARAEAAVLREAYAIVRAVRYDRLARQIATPVSGRTATPSVRRGR